MFPFLFGTAETSFWKGSRGVSAFDCVHAGKVHFLTGSQSMHFMLKEELPFATS